MELGVGFLCLLFDINGNQERTCSVLCHQTWVRALGNATADTAALVGLRNLFSSSDGITPNSQGHPATLLRELSESFKVIQLTEEQEIKPTPNGLQI